jgi:hypothetical protein
MVCFRYVSVNTLHKGGGGGGGGGDDDYDNNNNKCLSKENSMTCIINCKYRIASTLHALKMWFVWGISL